MELTLTVLDTAGIQDYIFGSNMLRENIGASELVYQATRLWAFEALADMKHNIDLRAAKQDKVEIYHDEFHIEDQEGPAAEVIYAGGGNTVILFKAEDSLALAKDFVFRLSHRLLTNAPGLNLYAAHQPYTWADPTKSLAQVVNEALRALGKLKGQLPVSQPVLGLGVTATCISTGLPANEAHPDQDKRGTWANRASLQVVRKWQGVEAATNRLRRKFPEVERAGFEWTEDLDNIGNLPERGESYIAVVHADGNGVGRQIMHIGEKYSQLPDQPRAYIREMRNFSCQLQGLPLEALGKTIRHLVEALKKDNEDSLAVNRFVTVQGKKKFPFRPIVFGGDDVTWVCAGPWGVTLAHSYLKEFEKLELKVDGEDKKVHPYACAGIAIVKTHYPFSQAYQLSAELTDHAKKRVLQIKPNKQASAIDWHFSTTGLSGKLEEIRQREYAAPVVDPKAQLHARPLLLDSKASWRNWATFYWLSVIQFGEEWWEKRNKVMALREALREGPTAVNQFSKVYRQDLPMIAPGEHLKVDGGWVLPEREDLSLKEEYNRSLYFDAVEVADHFFYLPIAEEALA